MDFLESNNILVDNQHGFRQKRSTETQLLSTIHEISSALNEKKASHLAILDFTKAFDKVPHERLLMKLHHYGITDFAYTTQKNTRTRINTGACRSARTSKPVYCKISVRLQDRT